MINVYGLTQVSRTAGLAVSLATCKAHMRIINTDTDDDYITQLIENATDWLEHITNRAFVNTVYDYTLDSFPYYITERIQPILWGRIAISLPKAPVVSVESVKYRDFENAERTFSDWGSNLSQEPAKIVPDPQSVWPYADVQRPTPVTIRFTAGYGGAIPPRARTTLMYLVAHAYENREPVVDKVMTTIPYTLKESIRSLRYML